MLQDRLGALSVFHYIIFLNILIDCLELEKNGKVLGVEANFRPPRLAGLRVAAPR